MPNIPLDRALLEICICTLTTSMGFVTTVAMAHDVPPNNTRSHSGSLSLPSPLAMPAVRALSKGTRVRNAGGDGTIQKGQATSSE